MSRLRLCISIFVMLSVASCDYEPRGIYERDLDPVSVPPEMTVVELDLPLDEDTVVLLYRHVWFRFESPGNEISWIKYYSDNNEGETVRSANGYFILPFYGTYDTYHTLRIEIFVPSGTGSLADSLGMEGSLFTTMEWVIRILDTPYSNLTAKEKDGFLRLRWPPAKDTLLEYTVFYGPTEIGRTTECEYTDMGYVGQGGKYSVYYHDSNNGNILKSHGWVELPEENRIGYNCDRDNNYCVTFDKPVYYAVIDTLVLVGYDNNYSRLVKDWTTDLEQGCFTIPDSLFGIKRRFWMVAVPKYFNPFYNQSYSSSSLFASPQIEFMIGFQAPAFDEFFPLSSSEFIYHGSLPGVNDYRDYLLRYSLVEDTVVDYVAEPSPDPYVTGIYFRFPAVSADGSYYTARPRFSQSALVGSPFNLNDYKVVDISGVSNPSFISSMPVSNTGTGIILSTDKKYLYDFRNEVTLGTINSTTLLSGHGISPDGEYFFLRVPHTIYLYSWRNGTVTLEQTLYTGSTPFYDYFDFFGDEPGMAAGWDSATRTFYKVRCSDMGIVNSFAVSEEKIMDIDYHSDMILSFSPYLLVVRSLNDGTLLFRIPVSFSYAWDGMFRLCGGSVFHEDGARYFLK